jgi:hypothetical protein
LIQAATFVLSHGHEMALFALLRVTRVVLVRKWSLEVASGDDNDSVASNRAMMV